MDRLEFLYYIACFCCGIFGDSFKQVIMYWFLVTFIYFTLTQLL